MEYLGVRTEQAAFQQLSLEMAAERTFGGCFCNLGPGPCRRAAGAQSRGAGTANLLENKSRGA